MTPDAPPDPPSISPPIRLLVTTGPTWEPVDDVRYLGNRSSGRMGLEIAQAAVERGHETTVLVGPGVRIPPIDAEILRFRTADDLDTILRDRWPRNDLLVMAAAVADHRPIRDPAAPRKLRRGDGPLTLELEPVPDLLAGLASIPHPGTRVGFALEPRETLENSARGKLVRKTLHAIVANPLETMESDHVDGRVITEDGRDLRPPSGPGPKPEFARWLVPILEDLHAARAAE